jgi:dephospho-CoA kinase
MKLHLQEGVRDPAIFKAIFLAGGSGAGKSFVAHRTTEGHGFKVVNSDIILQLLLNKLSMHMDFAVYSSRDALLKDEVRNKARMLAQKQIEQYQQGKLGVVLDGTGKDYSKIALQRDKFLELGYDTYIIFVNTSLEVALERNRRRERRLSDPMVTKIWHQVQENIGKFQILFGRDNFYIVDNDHISDDVLNMLWIEVSKIAKQPPKNPVALQWIRQQGGR